MRKYILLAAIVLLFGVTGCDSDDTKKSWLEVLSKCATTDIIGSQSIFFGASNNLGPGSVWRREQADGSYRLMFELSDMISDQATAAKLVKQNNVATCTGASSTEWSVKAGIPFDGGATPLSGEVKVDLEKATKITVKVNGWSIYDLKETLWKEQVAALPQDNAFRKDIFADNRLLLENAVQVSGFSADFEFSKSDAVNLKAKYGAGKGIKLGVGDNDATLDVNWTSDTTMTVTSPGDFFIIAGYSDLKGGTPDEREQLKAEKLSPQPAKKPKKVKNERSKYLSEHMH